jgi:hypothetical protein
VNTASAAGVGPQNQPVSATASATVRQVKSTATIDATGTTCQQIASGTAVHVPFFLYSLKGQTISQVNPGVFFYDNVIKAPSSSFTISILQGSDTTGWPLMELNGGQFILWNSDCTKVQSVTLGGSLFQPTLSVTGAIAGATYYIQVKFDPNTLLGYKPVSGTPTVTYLFQTSLTGTVPIPSSGATIKAVWKK